MAPKKKKTQLKPIARGFATTSVPKKVVEVPKEPEVAPPSDIPDPSTDPSADTAGQNPKAGDAPVLSEEDQALQNLIEKFQDKVEKEIVRTVKVGHSCLLARCKEPHVCCRLSNRTDGSPRLCYV